MRISTRVLPRNHWLSVAICAAPCMSGGMTQNTSGVVAGSRLLGTGVLVGDPLAGQRVDALAEGEEDVLVAPHDALGHAGGAAGVDDVDVVVGALGEVALG